MSPAVLLLVASQLPAGQPFSVPAPGSAHVATLPGDEAAVRAAHLTVSGPALLAFFRTRSVLAPDADRIAELVNQLRDPAVARRDQASGQLVCQGQAAVLALRRVVNNGDDREAAERARHCLQSIEGASGAGLTQGAVRLLVAQRPPGAAEALLQFVPFAEDEQVVDQVQTALIDLGRAEVPASEALRAALKDASPVRRAVAASVLARVGSSHFAYIRPLLKDPRPSVRLKAAVALIDNHDAEAVPVLIDLLPDLPPRQRKEAEDYLNALAGEWALVAPGGDDLPARRLKRDLWAAWWNTLTADALRQEFRSRTLSDADRAQAIALLDRLDQAQAEESDKASEALTALGAKVAPLLRQAANRGNPRQAAFAGNVLASLEKDAAAPLPTAAVRLLALRDRDGAAATLLAYLPFAETADAAEQIQSLIAQTGWKDGRPADVLTAALQDAVGVRRAAAGLALLRFAPRGEGEPPLPPARPEHLAAVRKLLQDPDAEVRLALALALTRAGERAAPPVLIALLAELPPEQSGSIEEVLSHLAGANAPAVALSGDPQQRKRCRDAWGQWWGAHGGKINLAEAARSPSSLGHLVVIESYNATRRTGTVAEIDRAGKVRWQVTNLSYPIDAQVLPNGRVLVAEQNVNRVSERDQAGNVFWQRSLASAFHVRRLRNGHTFLAGRQHILEIDAQGKEVLSYHRPGETILAVRRLPDGQTAFVTYQGNYVRLDAKGKEVRTFRVPFNTTFGVGGADVVPGDRVLISVPQTGKVTEYDADGKVAWEAAAPGAMVPTRLSNGHTLVATNGTTPLIELDRGGKIVSQWKDLGFRPVRAYRR